MAKLRSLRVMDTLPEEEFDDLAEAASALLDVPIASVSLIAEERQWSKAKVGSDLCETRRDVAFCAHAILTPEPMVVPDTWLDERFRENPLARGERGIRFYAGAPIVVDGHAVGTLCGMDVVPRQPSRRQIGALAGLARQAAALLKGHLRAERLAESERRFEAFIQHAPGVVFLKDEKGRFRFVNEGFKDMFGLDPDAVVGLSCHDWLPAEVADAIAEDDERVRRTMGTVEIEETVPALGGEARALRTFKFPFETGGETWIGGICVDETKLRAAEASVRERNVALSTALGTAEAATEIARTAALRFEQLFAGLPVSCYTFDTEATIQEWNSAAEALWGIPSHVAFLRPVEATVAPPEDAASLRETIRRVLAGSSVLGEERPIRRPDGSTRWVMSNTFPLRNAKGQVVGGVSANVDVTERREMETELRTRETRFRTLVDSLQEGLTVQSADGEVRHWNPSATRMFGVDLTGQNVNDHLEGGWRLLREDGTPMGPHEHPMALTLRDGETRTDAVIGVDLPGQTVRWLSVNAALLPQAGTAASPEAVSSFVDITERLVQTRRIQEQLAQINAYSLTLEMQKMDLEDANSRLEALATTDGLTGLKNHRTFQDALRRRVDSVRGSGLCLAIAMLDVDRFKAYNDEFGHPAGDAVLRKVARALRNAAREADLVARYGGEEFVIVMPGADEAEAMALAEIARQTIEATDFDLRAVTASFGVACLGGDLQEAADLVRAADEALYASKSSGRNRVSLWRPAPRPASA